MLEMNGIALVNGGGEHGVLLQSKVNSILYFEIVT